MKGPSQETKPSIHIAQHSCLAFLEPSTSLNIWKAQNSCHSFHISGSTLFYPFCDSCSTLSHLNGKSSFRLCHLNHNSSSTLCYLICVSGSTSYHPNHVSGSRLELDLVTGIKSFSADLAYLGLKESMNRILTYLILLWLLVETG